MKTQVYLILNKLGVVGFRKSKPSLNSGQVAVKLNLDVSDKFFDRFVPEATMKIDDHQVIRPSTDVTIVDPTMERLLDKDK